MKRFIVKDFEMSGGDITLSIQQSEKKLERSEMRREDNDQTTIKKIDYTNKNN